MKAAGCAEVLLPRLPDQEEATQVLVAASFEKEAGGETSWSALAHVDARFRDDSILQKVQGQLLADPSGWKLSGLIDMAARARVQVRAERERATSRACRQGSPVQGRMSVLTP